MPRIPVHTVASAPMGSHNELADLEAKYGKVLNIFGEMAHAPVVLRAYLGLKQVLEQEGRLDGRIREAIALAVAAVNGCDYCQAAHTLGGRAAGLTEEQMIAIRSGMVELDAKLEAIIVLVREATAHTGYVSDRTWRAALVVGWSEVELTEVAAHIAVNLFSNYFNHLVQTDLDLPVAPAIRVAA